MSEQPFRGVDHVAIIVRDADAALPYYQNELGMQLIDDEINENVNVRLVYLDAGNVKVQLVTPLGPGPLQDHLRDHGEGLHHICFQVDEINEAIEDLTDGADVTVSVGGRNRRTCFLPDRPNGLIMELTEIEEVVAR
jgi:methylmalonyl-CoA/ethylmalonyl-CoA epimerase